MIIVESDRPSVKDKASCAAFLWPPVRLGSAIAEHGRLRRFTAPPAMTASVISHGVSAVSGTDHTKASGRAHYGTFYPKS